MIIRYIRELPPAYTLGCCEHQLISVQDVLVFDSETFGRVLVLDGVIQFTEKDEFSYQEMICHLPISAHPNPERVLVIGGGDGGVIRLIFREYVVTLSIAHVANREAAKHPGVHSVTLCEIDQLVIDTSKKYFPTMSEVGLASLCWSEFVLILFDKGFDHPKVTVEVKDGFKYLDDHPDTFDVIIVDSTDPVGTGNNWQSAANISVLISARTGPAEALFQENFFRKMHKSLRAGGIICTQAESIWLHLDIIEKLWKTCNTIYETVRYTYTTIPTYPSGQIGFMICCKGENDLTVPKTHLPESVKLK